MSLQTTWLRSHSGKYVVCAPEMTSSLQASVYLVDQIGDKVTLNSAVKPLRTPCPVRLGCVHFIFAHSENQK